MIAAFRPISSLKRFPTRLMSDNNKKLSPQLSELLEVKEAPRKDIIRLLWHYIRY